MIRKWYFSSSSQQQQAKKQKLQQEKKIKLKYSSTLFASRNFLASRNLSFIRVQNDNTISLIFSIVVELPAPVQR